jgi:hypothetical protein
MELIALKAAPAMFGVGLTTFMSLKKYDPNFPPVRGQAGRGFAFDLVELADYFAVKFPHKVDAKGHVMAKALRLQRSEG